MSVHSNERGMPPVDLAAVQIARRIVTEGQTPSAETLMVVVSDLLAAYDALAARLSIIAADRVGAAEPGFYVIDNVTGQRVSPPYRTEQEAAQQAAGINSRRGGSRFTTDYVPPMGGRS